MKKFLPGDVEFIGASITSPKKDAEIGFRASIIHIDIYEDIDAPTMMCDILIKDDINMVSNLPIVGEEVVTLVFSTPGFERVRMQFNVYDVTNESTTSDLSNKVYVLRCVSAESITNAKVAVDNSYSGMIDTFIPEILTSNLSTQKRIFIEPCKGSQTIVFPAGIQPLQAIDLLRRQAVSKKYSSSSFVFFENQAGFNFVTVEALLDAGHRAQQINALRKYTYSDNNRIEGREFAFLRTMINFEVQNRSDNIHKLQSGAFRTDVSTFDMVTKEFATSSYDLSNQLFKTTDRATKLVGTAGHIRSAINQQLIPKTLYMPKRADVENFVHEAAGPRNMFSMLLGETTVIAHIYGDSSLKVGDVINCSFKTPEVFSATDAKASKNKPRKNESNITGNYLVTKLRHMISNKVNYHYTQSVNLVKMGASA